MTEYVSLLRAVNVGGRASIRMTALREAVERMGLREVRSVLQSGNLVFEAESRPEASIEAALESHVAAALHERIEFFVRTAASWRAIVSENPFPDEAAADPAHLLVLFLKDPPPKEGWTRLRHAVRGRERFVARTREAYLVYPDGIGRSKLTPDLVERALRVRGTGRNWNTVVKLNGLLSV